MRLAGAPLTMASIAVLPVLLGLAVDYAIQYQARVEEAEQDADTPAAALRATRCVPTIATAGVATGVGFLGSCSRRSRWSGASASCSWRASPWPSSLRCRSEPRPSCGRGAAGAGATGRSRARPEARSRSPPRRRRSRVARWAAASRAPRAVPARSSCAPRCGGPGRILAVGVLLAAAGWALDSRTPVVSDLNALVPRDLPALRDLNDLQRATDVAGEVDVVVEGRDLSDPKVVAWMRDYQRTLLAAHGWSAARGCGRAELCPALSLPDLFQGTTGRTRADVRALLDAVPPYFSQAVITRDRRTANLAFGIKLGPLARQHAIMRDMRARLARGRPAGVEARLAGLPVLAAEANAALSSPWRRLGTVVAGLLAVGLALLALTRRWEHAWVPLVPIALATGWSALVLFALGVPLNPMSAALGALVIAISTEFSVLLSARFREERRRGYGIGESLRRTYRSTGAAVTASGVTAIAGFAVLAFSDVQMLKDFGRVTVVDLSVSLLGVLAVLPAVLVLAERRAGRGPVAVRSTPPRSREPVATPGAAQVARVPR